MSLHRQHFTSLTQLHAAATVGGGRARMTQDEPYFYGNTPPREFGEALRNGHHIPTTQKVMALYGRMRDALPAVMVPTFEPSIAGGRVDVPAYLSGEPECFWIRAEEESSAEPITILVDLTHQAGTDPETLAMLGATIAAAAVTASASRPVHVTAACGCESFGSSKQALVSIAVDMRAADVGGVALLLAQPATFRRAVLAVTSNLWGQTAQQTLNEGYAIRSNLVRTLPGVYVPALTPSDNGRTQDYWVEFAREVLKKIAKAA